MMGRNDPTTDPTDHKLIEQRRREMAKLHKLHGAIRRRDATSRGHGSSTLIVPTPEEVERDEKRAIEEGQRAYVWPADPAPHPLSGLLSRLRVRLPDTYSLSLDWEYSPPRVVLTLPLGPKRRHALGKARIVMEILEGPSDWHMLDAVGRVLSRAKLDISASLVAWSP